jgi:hypothetical protein
MGDDQAGGADCRFAPTYILSPRPSFRSGRYRIRTEGGSDAGPIGYRPVGGNATQPLSSRGVVRLTGTGCGVE